MVKAICNEIILRKNYLGENTIINTIYFGGGTPSLLQVLEIELILDTIFDVFEVEESVEISFEMNPDDVNESYLKDIFNVGINRLSIGIQSFNDNFLKFMNRAHNPENAKNCVLMAQNVGFENISADLIYGIPADNDKVFLSDLDTMLNLNISHISAYSLTIEEKTYFGRKFKKGELNIASEDFVANQFEILISTLQQNNFEQYEISNFCKNNLYSRHNSGYWLQKPYLGIGPSAHSYSGVDRGSNEANNGKYLQSLLQNQLLFVEENLTKKELANDYLLTSIRTKWGTSISKINALFEEYEKDFSEKILLFQEQTLIYQQNENIILTQKGKLLADTITEKLFIP